NSVRWWERAHLCVRARVCVCVFVRLYFLFCCCSGGSWKCSVIGGWNVYIIRILFSEKSIPLHRVCVCACVRVCVCVCRGECIDTKLCIKHCAFHVYR